jgi:hypothetical protein
MHLVPEDVLSSQLQVSAMPVLLSSQWHIGVHACLSTAALLPQQRAAATAAGAADSSGAFCRV